MVVVRAVVLILSQLSVVRAKPMEMPCSWPFHIRSCIANELRLTHQIRRRTLLPPHTLLVHDIAKCTLPSGIGTQFSHSSIPNTHFSTALKQSTESSTSIQAPTRPSVDLLTFIDRQENYLFSSISWLSTVSVSSSHIDRPIQ